MEGVWPKVIARNNGRNPIGQWNSIHIGSLIFLLLALVGVGDKSDATVVILGLTSVAQSASFDVWEYYSDELAKGSRVEVLDGGITASVDVVGVNTIPGDCCALFSSLLAVCVKPFTRSNYVS